MDAKLVVVGGDAKPAEIKLVLPAVIGRGRQATLILPHPLVSRAHCEITECEGQLLVRDLDSLNGTYVNQRQIRQSTLPPGGLLTVGSVTFRAVYARELISDSTVGHRSNTPAQETDEPKTTEIPEMTEFVIDDASPADDSSRNNDTEPAVEELLLKATQEAEDDDQQAEELARLLDEED